MKNKLLLIITTIFMCFPFIINAKEITGYLFYGSSCPHCHQEEDWFKTYDNENFTLVKYEVWNNEDNQKIFIDVQKLLNVESKGVPYLVIGNKVIPGYLSTTTPQIIKDTISYYESNEYIDYVGSYLNGNHIKPETPKVESNTIKVPILGNIEVKGVSLVLLATVLGFIDGFNPCALWILIFLIAMLFNMKNKKKMWILGIIFLVTSALVYALFMISWLNFAVFLNKISFIRILIGIFALGFGIINIIRYSKTKETGCEVVNDKKRVKIMDKIKTITSNKKFLLSILGIIALAISVNIIELACSLGLPVTFTQVLSMNDLSTLKYAIYIFIYIFFFMLDDLIIFIVAMCSLKMVGVSNKYTKLSHLIGGIVMIIMGILLVIKPEWLMFNF